MNLFQNHLKERNVLFPLCQNRCFQSIAVAITNRPFFYLCEVKLHISSPKNEQIDSSLGQRKGSIRECYVDGHSSADAGLRRLHNRANITSIAREAVFAESLC